ncbi:MAG: hypothetical protein AAFV72_23930 [Cyanobacteria bacterium J06635_1]
MCVIKFALAKTSVEPSRPDFVNCSRLMSAFEIAHQPSGWLQFSLSTAGLGLWLQQINQQGLVFQSANLASRDSSQAYLNLPPELTWRIHHMYSRCCTLLRLAAAHQIVDFCVAESPCPSELPRTAEATVARYRLVIHSFGDLAQKNPSAQRLIHTLIDTTDKWAQEIHPPALRQVKLAIAVADAFDWFYRATSLWGLTLEQQRQWCSLVRAVQVILQGLVLPSLGPLTDRL